MEEIIRVDGSMYYVLKTADILKFCNNREISQLGDIAFKIGTERQKLGKERENAYLVLNMADKFDRAYLLTKMQLVREVFRFKNVQPQIKDIAHHIVNAILKYQVDTKESAEITALFPVK